MPEVMMTLDLRIPQEQSACASLSRSNKYGPQCGALRSPAREFENDARRHVAMRQPLEHLVYCRQRLQFDIGLDLALGRKTERVGQIFPIAHERAANAN